MILHRFSPALTVLLSNSTPLVTGPLSNEELSWVGSMSSVGSVCGTIVFGIISVAFGPKCAMTFLAFPTIINWILIYFGNSFVYLLLARFIGGLTGGGFQSGTVLFVSEIADDNLRGRLGSVLPLARNVGLLTAFFVGTIVDYEFRPLVFIFFPILYLIWVSILPNTPLYYVKRGNFHVSTYS